jgi:hypothetical protein
MWYYLLAAYPVEHTQKLSVSEMYLLIALYCASNLFQVGMTLRAARVFQSTSRVWHFFLYATHQLLVGSAAIFWLVSYAPNNSFSSP